MKYLKYLIAGGIILIISSSYTVTTSGLSEGIYPGNIIPDFTVKNASGNEFKISTLRGQKILLNFWAAYDAQSRVNNILLSKALEKGDQPVKMLSVSLDHSISVFKKTIQIDGIGTKSQCIEAQGNSLEALKKYQLNKGFKNYLVDENGVIIATNLTLEEIKNL